MDDRRKSTRKQLTDMPLLESYLDLVHRAKLTDLERKLCDRKYLNGWTLIQIGEELGYSETHMKRVHRNALRKLTRQFAKQKGLQYDDLTTWVTMNMIYSDYCGVAKKMNVNNADFYVCMAQAFLDDKDAGEDKLYSYYKHIAK